MSREVLERSSPWPESPDRELAFILDTGSEYEHSLLTQWLDHHRPEGQPPPRVVRSNLRDDRSGIQYSPLLPLLNMQADAEVVPLRVVWRPSRKALESGPRIRDLLAGDPRQPKGAKARRLVEEKPHRVYLIAGESASLSALQKRFELQQVKPETERDAALASFIARQAALALDIAERRLQGGRYKVPRHIAEVLYNSPAYRESVQELASKSGRTEAELLEEARGYMREMVTQPNTFWLDFYAKFNNFILGLGYEDKLVADPDDIEKMRAVVRNYPSMLLWTHKTYLDGAVAPKIMYDNDFPMPHTFAGANMGFAGLGFLLRRAGGIFIRRSFQDNELYKLTLRHYIGLLMEKRFPMNWAFEGTRSRLGKLMPPRYGLLKYVLEACYTTGASNIHIIPISISYDLIRDVEEYATEQTGRQKRPESLSWFVGYLRSLAKPMGKVYMDIGEPVVLEQAPNPEDRLALSKIAFEVAVQANRVTPITFPSLVTTSLLAAAPRALTEHEVVQDLRELLAFAEQRGLRISKDFNRDYADHMDGLLGIMINEGIVSRYDQGPDIVYGIAPEQHPVASYYRNTVIHFFVTKAIAELALLKASEADRDSAGNVFWDEVETLRDLFKFEFFYEPSEQFRDEVRKELARYRSDWEDLLSNDPQQLFELLKDMVPLLAHASLLTYVESYSVVADMFAGLDAGEVIEQKQCIDQALKYAKQAYLQRRISSEASIGKLLFENAYKTMNSRRLAGSGGADLKTQRQQFARQLRDLHVRLDRLRALALSRRVHN